ncbi:MAG: ABC transporter ATP-binding protein [Candidatus Woesearchaeota archaeon]
MDSIIKLDKVWKIYDMGSSKIYANKDISLEIKKGEFVYVVGKSGSGKSTLLNMIGSLDYPSRGKIFLDNKNIADFSESELAQLRGSKIGFVFQSFNLISSMTALENVMLPMTFQNKNNEEKIKRAKELLDMVDMGHRYNNLPGELSGGERQRVAVARSLANDPEVIIADEPTGNLDSKTGKIVMQMFERINREDKKTIIIVTHDTDLVKRKSHHKVYKISDGELV